MIKAIALVLAVSGCNPNHEAAAGTSPAATHGIAIKDSLVPEFSGQYTGAFAKRDGDARTVIAFVRDCPRLTCAPGPWEPEQVAHTCPKAYIATLTIAGSSPDHYTADLKVAGPADHVATATIEHVDAKLSQVDNGHVAGSLAVHNDDADVSGGFTAEVCPRT
ncbi:MAG TPA: hypothetical protein VH143_30885 [Kofleriaceae bacterium]|nr:hypothetical protein [Kofleriaceae bacterium]